MSWQDFLNSFIAHRGHYELVHEADRCAPGKFVLLTGETYSGKSTSLKRIAHADGGAFIKLGPWIEDPEDVAITMIDAMTGTWHNRMGAERAINLVRAIMENRRYPIIGIDNLEMLDGKPQHSEVLARIISGSGSRFILAGASGTGITAARALIYNRNLTSLRQSTVTFNDFQPADPAFDNFIEDVSSAMPIEPGPIGDDERARATIYCLSEHGRLGEVMRFFRVLCETAMARDDAPRAVDGGMLRSTADQLMHRSGSDGQPYVQNPFASYQ